MLHLAAVTQKVEAVASATPTPPKVAILTEIARMRPLLLLALALALVLPLVHHHALQVRFKASGSDMQDLHQKIPHLPTGGSSASRACM